jgi:uncharacterized protein (TIGR03067 family)
MKTWLLIVAGFGLVLPAGEPAGDSRDIQGTWRVVLLMDSGENQAVAPQSRVVITPDKIVLKDKNYPLECSYRLEPGKNPKCFDLVMPQTQYPGIYELKGATLRICYNERPRGERPNAFVSLADSPNDVLLVLQRER